MSEPGSGSDVVSMSLQEGGPRCPQRQQILVGSFYPYWHPMETQPCGNSSIKSGPIADTLAVYAKTNP